MSEIFSWLKRAEVAKRKNLTAEGSESVEIHVLRESGPPGPAAESSLPVITPARIEVAESARFNLAAADYRVKTVLDPLTAAGEQYRLLRSKLAQMQKERGIKIVLVTSSVPFEGKTFTACCLAGVIGLEPGKRVLLIDADLRKATVPKELGMNGDGPAQGLMQVLRGERSAEEVLLKGTEGEFYLLPAGPVPEDPAELLSSILLERTIKSLAPNFDWVIIDSPPVMSMADATIIAPLCDAVLLVVTWKRRRPR